MSITASDCSVCNANDHEADHFRCDLCGRPCCRACERFGEICTPCADSQEPQASIEALDDAAGYVRAIDRRLEDVRDTDVADRLRMMGAEFGQRIAAARQQIREAAEA